MLAQRITPLPLPPPIVVALMHQQDGALLIKEALDRLIMLHVVNISNLLPVHSS